MFALLKNIAWVDMAGIVQLYLGTGKGKTTASVGQAVRAAGNGFRVMYIQFLKSGNESGEVRILTGISGITYRAFGSGRFLSSSTVSDDDRARAKNGIDLCADTIANRSADMIVLDEIGAALELELVQLALLLECIEKAKDCVDLVLTGRKFPRQLHDCADLITEFRKIKHPYDRGVPARRGIEF